MRRNEGKWYGVDVELDVRHGNTYHAKNREVDRGVGRREGRFQVQM